MSLAELPDTFVIERELGGGGMGRVVFARYASTGYPCAIKILLPEHRHDDELVGRFLNEAQLSNRIGHAGVRRVIDIGRTTDGLPFLVMEYLDGDSLEDLLERSGGLLTIGEALRIAARLLEVLAAAHAVGVLHRDIKPENIYVSRDGAIKILDFGVARMSGAAFTKVASSFGTLGYMSPEIALGSTLTADYKPDVWSVGVCLFRMLSGQMPVDLSAHASPLAALRAAATTPARKLGELLPRCPEPLTELVGRMLAFDPEHRFTAVEALAAVEQLELPAELSGQAAPWVWDPRVATRPRSARFSAAMSSTTMRRLDALASPSRDQTDALDDDLDELDELHAQASASGREHGPLHELVRLYLRRDRPHDAAAIAATLRFLGHADARERELAEQRDGSFAMPRGRVSRRQWREVLMATHPSPQLSALLARLWPVLAVSRASAYAELLAAEPALREVDDRAPANSESANLRRWIDHLAAVLDLAAPRLLVGDDDEHDLRVIVPSVARSPRPAVLAGLDALTPQPAAALAFRCGWALARMHPYLLAGTILPSSTRLRDAIHGAALLTSVRVSMSAEHSEKAETWRRLIESLLSAEQLDGLRRAVDRVVRRGGDTKAWLRGCQTTAARAGLLLGGNLDVAVELVRGYLADDDEAIVQDLVRFSVSRPYLELRRSLLAANDQPIAQAR